MLLLCSSGFFALGSINSKEAHKVWAALRTRNKAEVSTPATSPTSSATTGGATTSAGTTAGSTAAAAKEDDELPELTKPTNTATGSATSQATTTVAESTKSAESKSDEKTDDRLWIEKKAPAIARQFTHVPWVGCTLWDLIQPSFMFMVGVAMPYSFARRKQLGDSASKIARHTVVRALILIALGVLLRSKAKPYINVTFIDVVSQIGLGYVFVAMCVGRAWWVQVLVGVGILAGDWYLFYQHPVPELDEFQKIQVALATLGTKSVSEARAAIESGLIPFFEGHAAHWNPGTCWGVFADSYLLNAFPRPDAVGYTDGSYSTFNFLPSMVTMLLGVMAGELLRSSKSPGQKTLLLLSGGCAGLVAAMLMDYTIWPEGLVQLVNWKPTWTICPIVKKVWTPTWVIFSAGWCFLFLGGFYFVVDVLGWKWWTYPLVVLGTNSIAIYCLHQVFTDWIKTVIRGSAALNLQPDPVKPLLPFNWASESIQNKLSYCFASGFPGQILRSLIAFTILWLILAAMYRRKIFVRI